MTHWSCRTILKGFWSVCVTESIIWASAVKHCQKDHDQTLQIVLNHLMDQKQCLLMALQGLYQSASQTHVNFSTQPAKTFILTKWTLKPHSASRESGLLLCKQNRVYRYKMRSRNGVCSCTAGVKLSEWRWNSLISSLDPPQLI